MCQISSPLLSVRDEAAMLCPHAYGDIADRIARIPCICESNRVEMGGWQRCHPLLRYARGRCNQSRDQHTQSRFATATTASPEFVRYASRQYWSQLSQFRNLETSQRAAFYQYRRSGHGQCSNRSCAAVGSSAAADVGRSSGRGICTQHPAVRPQGGAARHACRGGKGSGRPGYAIAGNCARYFLCATGIHCQAPRWSRTSTSAKAAFLTPARYNAWLQKRFYRNFSHALLPAARRLWADSGTAPSSISPDSSRLNRCREPP